MSQEKENNYLIELLNKGKEMAKLSKDPKICSEIKKRANY